MAAKTMKVDFQKLKDQIDLRAVAVDLGYKVDASKGVNGQWVEMRLGDRDCIIVGRDRNTKSQFFFRRHNTGANAKGDVITLIRENLSLFPSVEGSEWVKIAKIMCDYANTPRPEIAAEFDSRRAPVQELDVDRYKTKELYYPKLSHLFKDRNISESTAQTFAPHLCMIRDTENETFKSYNLGFPYKEPGNEATVGYEIRGSGGFKSKAAGSNSSSAAWIADFAGDRPVKNVYCFESGYDAMSFYQFNQARIDLDSSVFVSVGGQMGTVQISSLLKHYAGARFHDCFDNDVAGRVYGIKMAAAKLGTHIAVERGENDVKVEIDGIKKALPVAEANAGGLKKHFDLNAGIVVSTAPEGFKDWNDVIRGERQVSRITETKYACAEHLAERRKSSLSR